jgi:hypothetical protein
VKNGRGLNWIQFNSRGLFVTLGFSIDYGILFVLEKMVDSVHGPMDQRTVPVHESTMGQAITCGWSSAKVGARPVLGLRSLLWHG